MRAFQRHRLILCVLLAGCGQSDRVPHSPARAREVLTEQQAGNNAYAQLTGQPHWFPLGEEVYHSNEIEEAQQKTLSFIKQPRWFLTDVAYPNNLQDVPTDTSGSRLQLSISESDDPSVLLFSITLTSTHAVLRQYEHRWHNVLPLLFAFYVDGNAIRDADIYRFSKYGGVSSCDFLIEPGESKTWHIRVNAHSILNLIPDHHVHSLSVVAAFSECQHEGYGVSQEPIAASMSITAKGETFVPSLVVRSEPAIINWDGEKWTVLVSQ